jgi:hypothetical protein
VTAPAIDVTGPIWIEIVLTTIGLIGGAGGIAATILALLRCRRFRAGTAAALSDSTLTLVRPLKARVTELRLETLTAGEQVEAASREITELRTRAQHATATMREWRRAILAPDATLDDIRSIVAGSDPGCQGDPGGERDAQSRFRRAPRSCQDRPHRRQRQRGR